MGTIKIIGYGKNINKHLEFTGFLEGIRKCGNDVSLGKFKGDKLVPSKADHYIFCGYSEKWRHILEDEFGKVSIFCVYDPHIRPIKYIRDDKNPSPNSYRSISRKNLRGGYKFFKAPPDRWDQLKKDYDIEVKPWRKKGDHVVIAYGDVQCLDLPNLDINKIVRDAVESVFSTGRKVVICAKGSNTLKAAEKKFKDIPHIGKVGVISVLENAHCVVSYNGGAGLDSIIAGVPSISLYPNMTDFLFPNKDVCKFVADPPTPDRQRWFNWVAYQQWTIKEMREGLPWKFLTSKKMR